MKLTNHPFKAWVLSGLMLVGFGANAQFTGSYQFPQNTSYLGGRKPTNAASADALASYNYWKTNFVASSACNGQSAYRVIFDYYAGGRGRTDRGSTVSEGIAYGMLLSAYAGDRAFFDGFWTYYKQFRNSNGIMHWKIDNCGVVGQNGATDAELDVAMALVQASYQWQSNDYLNDAKAMIALIRQKEVESGSFVLKPGDQFGGSSLVNPSYFSPAYYRVFAQLEPTQASFWNSVLAKGYDIIFKADENTTTKTASQRGNGLVPDWCDANGNFASGAANYEDQGKNFIYDAIRTPWRTAMDVLWWGSTTAALGQKYCTRFTNWAIKSTNGDLNTVGAKYDLNGNKLNPYKNNTFVGCFAMAAMAASPTEATANLPAISTYPLKTEAQYQAFVDNGYTVNKNTNPGFGEYFNASFKVISQFVMTGNFYLPPPDQCTPPDLGSTVSLCKGSPQQLDSKITTAANVTYSWKLNGNVISGASGKTYSATTPGIYEVVVKQGTCTRRSSVEVLPAAVTADFSFNTVAAAVNFTNTSTGATGYKWEYRKSVNPPAGAFTAFTTSTVANPTQTFATGSWEVRLTADNVSLGCAGTNSKSRVVTVGGGKGWVADDFNDYSIAEIWKAEGGGYQNYPVTWCSASDKIAGNPPVCSNMPCGLYQVVLTGGTGVQYNPFGINLRDPAGVGGFAYPLDIKAVPFVSIRLRATKTMKIGVGFNDKVLTTNRIMVDLVANTYTTVNLDFTNNMVGYKDALNPSFPVDFTKINAIQFFPYENNATIATAASPVTVDIDWIVIGGKSLPGPQFNRKVDKDGLLVYENPSGDGVTYVPVSSWNKKVTACSTTTTITALACTAEQVRWYGSNGSTILGTGFTSPALGAGRYIVELINQGGTLRDTVDVSTSNTTASFTVDQNNYEARFINTSTSFNKFTWNYGDPANDLPGSTKWELGYHNYKTAATTIPKQFTASLTVEDTVCGTSKTATQTVTINCNRLLGKVKVATGAATGCEGATQKFVIEPVLNAYEKSGYGWFPPTGALVSKAGILPADTATTRNITFSTTGPFKIEAYNDCGKVDTTINLVITPKPTSNFTFVLSPSFKADFTATFNLTPAATTTYAWTFGDVSNNTASGITASHTYPSAGSYNACLTVTNTCGTSTQTCKTVAPTVTSLRDQDYVGVLRVYPTLTSTTLNVEVKGTANLQIKNLSGITLLEKTVQDAGSVDVSSLSAGMYLIAISQNGEVMVKQFVKQ